LFCSTGRRPLVLIGQRSLPLPSFPAYTAVATTFFPPPPPPLLPSSPPPPPHRRRRRRRRRRRHIRLPPNYPRHCFKAIQRF